jgi:hypothetical protein
LIWFDATPSAPPVALDKSPEGNQSFPGANDTYTAPTNGFWRSAGGIAAAVATFGAILSAVAFQLGYFERAAPTSGTSDDPWVSAGEYPGVTDPRGKVLESKVDAGPDSAVDAGVQDAALDVSGPRAHRTWVIWTPADEQSASPEASTLVPTPYRPPALGDAPEPPEQVQAEPENELEYR